MNKPYIVAFDDIENWDEGQWFAVVFAVNEATASAALALDRAEWGEMDGVESLAGSEMYVQLITDDFDTIKEKIGLDRVERYMCGDTPSVVGSDDVECFQALAELAFPQERGGDKK